MSTTQTAQGKKSPKTARTARQWIGLVLSVTLLAVSTFYIGHILQEQGTSLKTAFETLSAQRIAIGLIMATLTLACSTLYHVFAVERLTPIRGVRVCIAAAYSLSQLVRYMPGKIFGVLFEVNYLRSKVAANVLVLANTVQMFYQYAGTTLFVLITVAVLYSGSSWPWALIATAIAAMFFAHRQGWGEYALVSIARRVPGVRAALTTSVNERHAALATTLMLACDWAFFISMWYVVDLGTSHITPYVLLAVCYAVASLLGALAVIMPSGLIVREGLFIWMAHMLGFDPIALVAYAAVVRMWLTAADILTGLLFGLADRLRSIVYEH